jgi:hypothetical protein
MVTLHCYYCEGGDKVEQWFNGIDKRAEAL